MTSVSQVYSAFVIQEPVKENTFSFTELLILNL